MNNNMNKECYEYYKFNRAPFSKIIEKEFLYKPDCYPELISRLEFAISERELAVITGENGVGKTTYCWYFIEQLKTKHRLGYIPNPRLSVNDFYREALTSLGVAEPKWIKKDLLDQVKNTLDYLYAESGEQPILLIDEAHLLKEIILDEIRLMTNIHFNTKKQITIILIGHTQLQKMISLQVNDSIKCRVGILYHISSFNEQETIKYIKFRCNSAGNKNPPFTDDALTTIHQVSKGITRTINKIANLSLLHGYNKNEKIISGVIVQSISNEL